MTATVTDIATKTEAQACVVRWSQDQSKTVVAGLLAAIGAASTDEARMILCNVLVSHDVKDGYLKFISTNSYRANRVLIYSQDMEHTPKVDYMVPAKQLKDALPKPSEFKNGTYLTWSFIPGRAELDAGHVALIWGDNQRLLPATPAEVGGSRFSQYPDVEKLIDGTISEQEKGTTNEATGWNPEYLGDICSETKRLHKKDGRPPVMMTPGLTELKPGIFTYHVEGISYESLLMPVRKP